MSKIDLDELENKLQVITRWPLEDELYGDVLTPKVILELIRRLREAEMDAENLRNALSEYANPLNWGEDQQGIRRVWLEPDTTTPEAYNGFELARKGANNG
jgi:hypothetical protein